MKKYYRFFGGLIGAQERWLNRMAQKGCRLVCVGKLLYGFEACEPNRTQYCVEFIGHKSKSGAEEYRDFLEDMGYRVFYKNSSLNYSVGKVCWRPWAEKGGRLATNATTFNRELLIIEKENDGRPFVLHTTFADRLAYYKAMRKPYLFICAFWAILGAAMGSWVWEGIAAVCLVPLAFYQVEIIRLAKRAKTEEW